MQGKDVYVSLPTRYGKSLIYSVLPTRTTNCLAVEEAYSIGACSLPCGSQALSIDNLQMQLHYVYSHWAVAAEGGGAGGSRAPPIMT